MNGGAWENTVFLIDSGSDISVRATTNSVLNPKECTSVSGLVVIN